MKTLGIALTVLLSTALNVSALTSPSSVTVRVFEMRASKNSNCSNAVPIFKTTTPTPMNLAGTPTLGLGAIADGTYHCLMFRISDIVTAVPQTTDGSCAAGVAFTSDFFVPSSNASITPEGVTIQPTNGEDDPWIYFSDFTGASSSNNCFDPTEVCSCGAPCPLPPQLVASDQTRTLVVNFNNQLDGSGPACALRLPVFSVR